MLCKSNRLVTSVQVLLSYLMVFNFQDERPEVEIIFPRRVHTNVPEEGVCYVKTWPQPWMSVTTNESSCVITTKPLRIIDTYTTAIFFTLNNINSSCLITCWTGNNNKHQRIDVGKYKYLITFHVSIIKCFYSFVDPNTATSLTTALTISPKTTPFTTCSASISTSYNSCPVTVTTVTITVTVAPTSNSGVLGLYRITLWIIVLTLSILSTTVNSEFL